MTSMMEASLAALAARTIEEMPFEGGDRARELLHRCGVKVASDIEQLGCTGAAKAGLTVEEIGELRLGIAGGGFGLPCYVDINRFCLAHNTIGGLQEQQVQRYLDYVGMVSRDLTPEEKGRIELIEAARRKDQGKSMVERLGSTGDILRGRTMADGFEKDEGDPLAAAQAVPATRLVSADTVWVCPEHRKTNWACRYCAAQLIVEGDLVPSYAICGIPEHRPFTPLNDASTGITGVELPAEIEAHDKAGAETVLVYVLAKTLTRRLG